MLFRQLFDHDTYSFSYILGCELTREAIIIDPVLSQVEMIRSYLDELKLKLVKSIETHVHADHITGSGKLRDDLGIESYSAEESQIACSSKTFSDGDQIHFGELALTAIATPGHTDDSYSFKIEANHQKWLFTGDTLFIRGSGRTDFQNGDSAALFNSLTLLMQLPEETLVYPAHDYKGRNMSTIAEEKRFNPRFVGHDKQSFIEMMDNLDLPEPKYIDVAVPANKACGEIMEA